MAYDYEKAYALRDDPFKPRQLLAGLTNPPLQDSLEIRPLLWVPSLSEIGPLLESITYVDSSGIK